MPHAIPRPWTPTDEKKLAALAARGLSAREAAVKLRRTTGAVKFAAMTRGIRFHAIEQPKGVQQKLARRRRKFGMTATLRSAA
jgi:hypothetical protein